MIYQATHHVNFAQGAMAMFSTYIAWAMIDAGFPYWAAFGLTLVSSFAADVAIEEIIIRPVERGPVLNIVIVFIGLLHDIAHQSHYSRKQIREYELR